MNCALCHKHMGLACAGTPICDTCAELQCNVCRGTTNTCSNCKTMHSDSNDMSMSLRDIITKHPEWLDHKVVVSKSDGNHDYVGAAGSVFEMDELVDVPGEDCKPTGRKLVVFSAN